MPQIICIAFFKSIKIFTLQLLCILNVLILRLEYLNQINGIGISYAAKHKECFHKSNMCLDEYL